MRTKGMKHPVTQEFVLMFGETSFTNSYPPFPTHRDANQLSLDVENKNDQDIPELVDMTLEQRGETMEEGERMLALHEAAAEAYAQGMCTGAYLPDTPHTPKTWAHEIANTWREAQKETKDPSPRGGAKISKNSERWE